MHFLVRPRLGWVFFAAIVSVSLSATAFAAPRDQLFGPPSTFVGMITDSAGPVPAGVKVEAYIGDTLCGTGKTESYAGGTAYAVDVVSKEQTAGCGEQGVEVRIKVGDRFAKQTGKWDDGGNPLVQLDLAFGSATPVAIPTSTPTPTSAATKQTASSGTPTSTGSNAAARSVTVDTVPAGSPGAGSPIASPSSNPTGGLTSASSGGPGGGDGGGGGGFPIWGIVLLAFGGVAAAGGGIGYAMSRRRHPADDTSAFPPSI
jgi:hypothetical protein